MPGIAQPENQQHLGELPRQRDGRGCGARDAHGDRDRGVRDHCVRHDRQHHDGF